MAYALRGITNRSYVPYGNGRDWFFLGDASYRNGRRTPSLEQREQMESMIPPGKNAWKPKGIPKEMTYGAIFGTGSPRPLAAMSTGVVAGTGSSGSHAAPKKKSTSLGAKAFAEANGQHSSEATRDATGSRRAASTPAATVGRWHQAHVAASNLPAPEVWRRQGVKPRREREAADAHEHVAELLVRQPSAEGHLAARVAAPSPSHVKADALREDIQVWKKQKPLISSQSYGRFQTFDESHPSFQNKYKTFSMAMEHDSRWNFLRSSDQPP
eukprot:TRINITY_DN50831_c0_g1_i1.p1 TRINITY_DN50831_c0_g1~~TRINITY_DN50831_c0_g1_i1.p1  ORF type:complete len:308 (-),score=40.85 TRINITY_DN50831_c0_g1_i1:173-982(-)